MATGIQEKADLAAIFAGGGGTRMGGIDKGAILLGGKPLCEIVAGRLEPQADAIAVLAPAQPAWLVNIADAHWIVDSPGAKGPGAGLLAALHWLRKEMGPDAVLLTSPVDAPFLPNDLFVQLEATRRKAAAPAAIVRHADGLHPVFGVWQASCASFVEQAAQNERALHRIALWAGAVLCQAWTGALPDPFTNLNSPEDVALAENILNVR